MFWETPYKTCKNGVMMQSFDYFFDVSFNKLLSEQLNIQWTEMPWCWCDVTIMIHRYCLSPCLHNITMFFFYAEDSFPPFVFCRWVGQDRGMWSVKLVGPWDMWPWYPMLVIFKSISKTDIISVLWNCPLVNARRAYWCLVNIDSGFMAWCCQAASHYLS